MQKASKKLFGEQSDTMPTAGNFRYSHGQMVLSHRHLSYEKFYKYDASVIYVNTTVKVEYQYLRNTELPVVETTSPPCVPAKLDLRVFM